MSKFPHIIKYKGGYKYQLVESYFVDTPIRPGALIVTRFLVMQPSGRLGIHDGYAWDGPSGPSIDTANFMRGSLVHDALYQLMRERHLGQEHRAAADELLRQICIEDGMSWFRAWYVYRSVRVFGGRRAAPEAPAIPSPTAGESP